LESLSSLLLGNKYPVNFAVPNASDSVVFSDGYTGDTDLERVIVKIIELAVELRNGKLIKEVLLHVRGALQAVHALAFEAALRVLHSCAERKVVEAESSLLVQDLSVLDLDEEGVVGVGIGSGSGENDTSSTSAVWFRFYWELLRIILDLSRNNSRLEQVYNDTVLAAFQFCRRFGRKREFRRLCENVRYHLNLSVKYPGQANAIPLSTSASSHQAAMDIRFSQLSLACDMELWQEAFRTVEDIYHLQSLSRKSMRHLDAPEFFEKLVRIFAKSDNFLFLAATLLRQANLEAVDVLVMATLAVPFESSSLHHGHYERLVQITGLVSVPTRSGLISAIEGRSLTGSLSAPLSCLYRVLSSSCGTSNSSSSVGVSDGIKALKTLSANESLRPFVRGCFENLLYLQVRSVMRRVSEISLEELGTSVGLGCAEGGACVVPKFNLELFLLRNFPRETKIDHVSGLVRFDRSILLSTAVPLSGAGDNLMVWGELEREMAKLLQDGHAAVRANNSVCNLKALLATEHAANLERRGLIERRKEQLEAAAIEKERRESRERALKAQQEAEADRLRQAEETARRDRERLELERAEIRRLEAEKRAAEQEKMKEAAGVRLNREKISAQATRLDHLERALRAAEIPLLEADYSRQKESDRAAYEARCALISQLAAAKHARDLEIKRRFIDSPVFVDNFANFMTGVRARRENDFERACEAAQIQLAAEKEKRKARIASEMEMRRKIEAEREQARSNEHSSEHSSGNISGTTSTNINTAGTSTNSTTGTWRRSNNPVSLDAPVTPAPTPVEKSSSSAYVPRHKRQSAN
jgi:translation initiation factor 3 subunit A